MINKTEKSKAERKNMIASAELSTQPLIGKETTLHKSTLGYACEIGERCKVSHSTLNDYSYLSSDCDVINTTIGKFCSIASHVRINPGNHPLPRVALHHFTYRASRYGLGVDEDAFFQWRASSPVTIGHDVWLGHGVVVLPGVTIGNGAAIGAGTIVTKDIAPYSIVVGNPGKVLRSRFSEEEISGLEKLAWWDWPPLLLAERLDDFRQLSVAEFVDKYRV
jgi:phosphonate metabolism protein (transferase hexapeptide repeat family)